MNKKGSYILGGFLIIFGILFIFSPANTFETIVLIAGVSIILFNVIRILFALKSDNPYAAYSITGSIVGVIFGFILISSRDTAIKVIPVLLGVWLLVTGISSFLFLFKSHANSGLIVRPVLKIILGAITFALPIIPVIATGIVLGIILVLAGVTSIVNVKDEEVIYKVKVKK